MLSLAQLALDIGASWLRLFIALGLSIFFGIFTGIAAATNRKAERLLLPLIDVLQTIPILGFFPVVVYLVVLAIPGFAGVNVAVIFLIFTSMAWNITFGVYEAVKSIPQDFLELARINRFSKGRMLRELYIPSAMLRIAYQADISWSVGLFYLVTSEIFSVGSSAFAVRYGIGVAIAQMFTSGTATSYATVLLALVAAIVLTRFLVLMPFSAYAERFSFKEQQTGKRSGVVAFYSRIASYFRSIRMARAAGRRHSAKGVIVPASWTAESAPRKESAMSSASFALALIALFSVAVYFTNAYHDLPLIASSLAFSFIRVWGMYLLCAAITVPAGILIAKSTRAYEPVLMVLQTVASIPATILLPAIVAAFYLLPFGNELVALSIIFLSMVWYLLFSVITGMRAVPGEFTELARVSRLKWHQVWKDLYLPAILPNFVTGSITAVGGAWNALIVAEYFTLQSGSGSPSVLSEVGTGIGKLLDLSVLSSKPDLLLTGLSLAAMVVMIVLINKFVWQRLYKHVTSRYRIEV